MRMIRHSQTKSKHPGHMATWSICPQLFINIRLARGPAAMSCIDDPLGRIGALITKSDDQASNKTDCVLGRAEMTEAFTGQKVTEDD
jgi:hypothetical protein